MKLTNGIDLDTDLGVMRIQIHGDIVEIYYMDNGEIVEGGQFSTEVLTKVIQEFYESEF